ncbi:MAG: ADOP family duplicated permease [Gemmatimonadota bacterium]|nr:ADOP family duplicated permease [Gemmatimonadota bacterium]
MSAPRWATGLLRLVALPGRSEDAIGDLNELHARRVERRGRLVAGIFVAFSALDLAGALLRQRLRGRGAVAPRGPHPDVHPGLHRGAGGGLRRVVDETVRDFGHAARTLRRAPGFATITIVTLALAIGAVTTIFSVVDTVLLDPLGYANSDRLVVIYASAPGSDLPARFGPAPEFYVQYREEADLLEDVAIWRDSQTTARWQDQIDRLFVSRVSPSLYGMLGATPALGRLPTQEDDPESVVLISHSLWENWFGSDPSAVGRSMEVSGEMRTIIGVMGPEFRFPYERISVWIHNEIPEGAELRPGNFAGEYLLGLMRPGTDIAQVETQLDLLASRLPDRFGGPAQYREIIERHQAVVHTLEEETVGEVARPLWLLLGTVAIVLLIACANVANLFSVRAESRRRGFDVRRALGARRSRLIRGQMAEAIVLALAGGALGVLLSWAALPVLVRLAPESIPNLDLVGIDGLTLAFTAGLSVLAAIAFGLVPSVRASKQRLLSALRQTGAVGEYGHRWGRDALVLVQTAAALVLLVGSGLLMRSFWTLTHVDPGYETEDIFSFQVAPQRDGVNDGPSFARFHEDFMERVAALPGVESVGLTIMLPLDEGAGTNTFYTEAQRLSGDRPPPLRMTMVGGDYFGTMGIALRSGRLFDGSDHAVGSNNIIVGEATAARMWPGEDPLGKRLAISETSTDWLTVVGVVEDIMLDDFRQDAPDPMVYLPMVGPTARSWGVGSPAYVVKTPRAGAIAPDIRALMREHVPESPMYRVFTMEALAQRSMAQLSFTMLLLAIASGLALILGTVGLYGVLSYVVSTRNREIAVRMALGAENRRVRRMVVLQGARITAAGVAAGLLAAVFLTRVLDSLLFGVESLDVATFTAMSTLMLTVAFLASYLPARRASSVDPMESLRAE